MKLFVEALTKFLAGLVAVAVLIFLSAGTLAYRNGWLFMILMFVPMFIFGLYLFAKKPDLLRKRLNIKEKENTQKGVIGFSALFFIAGFIVAGLDFRFGWTSVPLWAVIVAADIFVLAYLLYAEVIRENAYLSRTIDVSEGQTVVDNGMYAVVRHPMYSVTLFLFLSIPIILGSWWSLFCFLPYPVLIIIRILNEEKVLTRDLNGYAEYKKKVKYRLIPFIW